MVCLLEETQFCTAAAAGNSHLFYFGEGRKTKQPFQSTSLTWIALKLTEMLALNFCELWINSCVWQLKRWKSIWYLRTKVLHWCRDGCHKYCWGFLHSERDIKQCFLSFVLINSSTSSKALLSAAKKIIAILSLPSKPTDRGKNKSKQANN